MAGALEGDLFIGPKAEEYRGLLNIKYPMEHGIVTDWNDMERIWQYIYSKEQLQTFSEEVTYSQVLPCLVYHPFAAVSMYFIGDKYIDRLFLFQCNVTKTYNLLSG